MKRFSAIAAQAFCLLLLSQAVSAGPKGDPLDWLERMSAAMSQMTWQGTFVYNQGDRMETMRITHVSDEDGVRERMVSLSGAPGEVLRDANGVRWALGHGGAVLADSAFKRPFFPALPADQADKAEQSYTFKFGGKSLISGHIARNIKVVPRDHYRYGYSLWLEENSGLLLKWELLDMARKSLARLMFTDFRLGAEVDISELEPGSALKNYEAIETELPAGQTRPPRWEPSRLPPGFVLTSHRSDGETNDEYEHLVYSDGLAAVSVYIESLAGGAAPSDRTWKHGTTHAFTCAASGMKVTVVGNVPAATAEVIGQSVRAVR